MSQISLCATGKQESCQENIKVYHFKSDFSSHVIILYLQVTANGCKVSRTAKQNGQCPGYEHTVCSHSFLSVQSGHGLCQQSLWLTSQIRGLCLCLHNLATSTLTPPSMKLSWPTCKGLYSLLY